MATNSFTNYPAASTQNIGDFDVQAANTLRKRKLAEMLQQQALDSPSADGYDMKAPIGVGAPIAKMAKALASVFLQKQADDKEAETTKARDAATTDWIDSMPQSHPEQVMGPPDAEGNGQVQPAYTPSQQDLFKWAAQGGKVSPYTQKISEQITQSIAHGFDPTKNMQGAEYKDILDPTDGKTYTHLVNKFVPGTGVRIGLAGNGDNTKTLNTAEQASLEREAATAQANGQSLPDAKITRLMQLRGMNGDVAAPPPQPGAAPAVIPKMAMGGVGLGGVPAPQGQGSTPPFVPYGGLQGQQPQQGPGMVPQLPGPGRVPLSPRMAPPQQPAGAPQPAQTTPLPPEPPVQGTPTPTPAPPDASAGASTPIGTDGQGKPVLGNYSPEVGRTQQQFLTRALQDAKQPGGPQRDDRPQGRGTYTVGPSVVMDQTGAPPKITDPYAGIDESGARVAVSDQGLHYIVGSDAKGNPTYTKPSGQIIPRETAEKQISAAQKADAAIYSGQSMLDLVNKNPGAFGMMSRANDLPLVGGYAQQALFTKDEMNAQTSVGANTAGILHELYGSALSTGEQQRAKKFLPDAGDPPSVLASKLKSMMEAAERSKKELTPAAVRAATERMKDGRFSEDKKERTVKWSDL